MHACRHTTSRCTLVVWLEHSRYGSSVPLNFGLFSLLQLLSTRCRDVKVIARIRVVSRVHYGSSSDAVIDLLLVKWDFLLCMLGSWHPEFWCYKSYLSNVWSIRYFPRSVCNITVVRTLTIHQKTTLDVILFHLCSFLISWFCHIKHSGGSSSRFTSCL